MCWRSSVSGRDKAILRKTLGVIDGLHFCPTFKVKIPTLLRTKRERRMGHPGSLLSLYEFAEHFFWIDGDENSLTAGQDFALFVHDFRHVDVLAAVDGDFPALDAQRLMQRYRLQVFHRHLFRQRNYVT